MAFSLHDVVWYGDHISTTVTASSSVVDRWITEIMWLYRHKLDKLIVGLDTEWFLRTKPDEYQRIAILQLCVGRNCLVYQLCHADYFPKSLVGFLGNPKFTFVGKEVGGDMYKLMVDYGLEVRHGKDAAYWAASKYGDKDYRHYSLKRLVYEFLSQKELKKPREITLSEWSRKSLSYEQIEYACLDAFVSFKLGEFLRKPRSQLVY